MRTIDISNGYENLSDEDLRYLSSRSQLPIDIDEAFHRGDLGGGDASGEERDLTQIPYVDWTKAELHAEHEVRGLEFKAKDTVATLADQLTANDEAGE